MNQGGKSPGSVSGNEMASPVSGEAVSGEALDLKPRRRTGRSREPFMKIADGCMKAGTGRSGLKASFSTVVGSCFHRRDVKASGAPLRIT